MKETLVVSAVVSLFLVFVLALVLVTETNGNKFELDCVKEKWTVIKWSCIVFNK